VGNDCFILYRKQFFLNSNLRKWNKEVFGHVQVRIAEFSRNIEKIQLEDPTEGNVMEEAKLQAGMC
jgi:hypothetical protein